MNYYDKQGNPITLEQYVKLNKDPYRRVGYSIVGQFKVSTIWIGIDNNFGFGNKAIFETMVFPLDSWTELYGRRYTTEEEARIGHTKAMYLAGLGRLS